MTETNSSEQKHVHVQIQQIESVFALDRLEEKSSRYNYNH